MPAIHNHPCALPQGDNSVRPTLTGGIVGRKRCLEILDSGQMLHDARTVISPRIDAVGKVGAVFHDGSAMQGERSRDSLCRQQEQIANVLWEFDAWPIAKMIWLHKTI